MYKIKSPRLRSHKVVIGIDVDDIENLADLLRVVLINEECENLKVVVESFRNINQKIKSDFLQGYRSLLCNKSCRRGYFFNKQVEYCQLVR